MDAIINATTQWIERLFEAIIQLNGSQNIKKKYENVNENMRQRQNCFDRSLHFFVITHDDYNESGSEWRRYVECWKNINDGIYQTILSLCFILPLKALFLNWAS